MAKKLNLTIPQPCHQNWDNMQGSEKARFCGACQKEVIDFTTMTDQQIIRFFKKPAAVCGRLSTDQLNRTLTLPKKRLPWMRYFFSMALPAFLVQLKASSQQRAIMGKIAPVCASSVKGKVAVATIDTTRDEQRVTGKIIDSKGLGVPNASILMKGTYKGTTTDNEGKFILETDKIKSMALVITSVGFEKKEVVVTGSSPLTIVLEEWKESLAGEIVITMGLIASPNKKKNFPVIKPLTEPASVHFTVYPNPARAGSKVQLTWKQPQHGNFVLHLLTNEGKMVATQNVWMDVKGSVVTVSLPNGARGVYYIRLTHEKTGQKFTEKIIVQ